jgi:hypothetical protein
MSDNKDAKIQDTHWDEYNTKTLERWIRECNKQEYIYDSVLEKIKERSKLIKLILMIITTISMLLSTSGLGLNENTNIYLNWTYKILLTVLSSITYILTSYQKLENYDDIIEQYTRYTDKIGNFLASIVSISEIKKTLRPDGDKYIIDNRKIYSDIYRESPYIKHSHWKKGIASYNNYVLNVDNDYCSRKRNDIVKYVNNISNDNHVIDIEE